ncbi:hypothetical protein FNV43_RR09775 [Rhamnella rubrinervis]|uniref:Uncharacterized protein n=1 Tax=Rhamnella rubrinervis TaxID=2594499 RepID=A0A8K0HB20_9ROSA|nr:hypothetical protein FNV43_RR09775 [Rhamnella rubrinervis]
MKKKKYFIRRSGYYCKHEIEAETRPEKNIKDKGKATLKSPPESYGPYSPKRNSNAKSVFTRLGSTIDQVQPRLRSDREQWHKQRHEDRSKSRSQNDRESIKSQHNSTGVQADLSLQVTISRDDQHRPFERVPNNSTG